jgi:hypothetical protein
VAFQIKDFASIVSSIVNHMRGTQKRITDFQPGSVARTLVEGPAVEIEELYLQMFTGLREAIPVATFLSFGFDKLPAKRAHGLVSISVEDPLSDAIVVPLGTTFTTADGRSYTSTAEITWAAGTTMVRIPVQADVVGLDGNVAAGVITSSPAFDDTYTISNLAIENGSDVETDSEREARFADFIVSLSRGTIPACLYAARAAHVLDSDGAIYEYVTRIGVTESPGYVRIFVYSSRGIPSDQLLANGQTIIDGWRDPVTRAVTPGYRAGGVRVDVLPMIERAISFSIRVEMLPGYTLSSSVIQQLSDVFATAVAGVEADDVLYVGTVVDELLSVQGVKRVVPDSNENIVCGANETLIAGTFTVTPL